MDDSKFKKYLLRKDSPLKGDKVYDCGCVESEEGERFYCLGHWKNGYFAGIISSENRKIDMDRLS
jgi:hypothetical protein